MTEATPKTPEQTRHGPVLKTSPIKSHHVPIHDHKRDEWAEHVYPLVHTKVSHEDMLGRLMPGQFAALLNALVINEVMPSLSIVAHTESPQEAHFCTYLDNLSIFVKKGIDAHVENDNSMLRPPPFDPALPTFLLN